MSPQLWSEGDHGQVCSLSEGVKVIRYVSDSGGLFSSSEGDMERYAACLIRVNVASVASLSWDTVQLHRTVLWGALLLI